MVSADVQDAEPVGGRIGEVVWWDVGEGVGFEAEAAADAVSAAVAGGKDVGVGIADHDGFGGSNLPASNGAGFGDESLEAVRIGLFGVEAVAAVVLEEEG